MSTMASRTVGMNLEIVLSAIRKLYINRLNVAQVAICLSVIASFSPGSNGSLKINNSKKYQSLAFILQFSHLYLYIFLLPIIVISINNSCFLWFAVDCFSLEKDITVYLQLVVFLVIFWPNASHQLPKQVDIIREEVLVTPRVLSV